MASRIFERLQSTYNDCSWSVLETRGADAEPLVDYIVLAEFDIDTGSTVRYQFPSAIPGYKEDWFAEHMLPEGAHNREQDWTYMILNRDEEQIDERYWIAPSERPKGSAEESSERLLYGINLVRNKADRTVRRGAVVKAMAIFSRYHYCEIFRAPLMAALDEYYAKPSVDILQELFTALNSVSLASCPRPNPIEQRVMHLGVSASSPRTTTRASPSSASTSRSSDDDYPLAAYTPSRWYFRAEISLYSSPAVPLALALHTCPDDVGAANLSFLLRVFQLQGSMRIFNAVLTRKRVLFVGYDHAAGDVSQMVLSAVAMVAPPLCGVIRRAFPYVNLTDLSFLEVDGFIAGATNPMFQQHNTWWDLLCVLDLPNKRGVVQTAEEHRAEEAAQKGKQYTPLPRPLEDTVHESADAKFISFVLSGLEARLGEEWVKTQFYEYTHEILMQAWDVELLKELEGRDSPPLFPAPILTGAAGGSARLARGSAGMSTNGATGGAVGAASPPPVAPAGVMVDKRRKRAEANKFRAAAVRRSPEFRALPINPWAWHEHRKMKGSRGGMGQMTMAGNVSEGSRASGKMLLLQLRRLQHDKDLDGPEAEAIFSLLEKGLHDEEALQGLLTIVLPESLGGLSVLGVGLLHPNKSVKRYASLLLRRLEAFPSTAPAATTLNTFFRAALSRQDDSSSHHEWKDEI